LYWYTVHWKCVAVEWYS